MRDAFPALQRGLRTLALLCALTASGCDYSCGVARTASYPGANPAQVREALARDPSLRTTVQRPSGGVIRIGGPQDVLLLRCEREGVAAYVDVTRKPDRVRVEVSAFNRRPTAEEARRWTERVEYVCDRLSAATPALGAWETGDHLDPPHILAWLPPLMFVLGPAVIVTVAIVIARRRNARTT